MKYGKSITLGYCSGCALLVQLVERRSPKPDVGGSSPPGRVLDQVKKLLSIKIAIIN